MTTVEYELLKELTDISKRILALNNYDVSFSPMMMQSVKHHINGLQRLIFSRDGIRAYRQMHSNEIVEGLKTADPKLRQDIIKTMRLMGMPIPEQKKRHFTKREVMELKELMRKGKPAEDPVPEIRTFKPGAKIPKGWQRVPYTQHQYAKVGDTKLVNFKTVEQALKNENIHLTLTPPNELEDHVRRTGSRMVGGVHSGSFKGNDLVNEDGEIKFINGKPKKKAAKKNIKKKSNSTKPAGKKAARKK